jgi:hypothetical membrane protein
MTAVFVKADNDQIHDTRRGVPAAIALLTAAVFFLVAETIAAAAWDNPAYSYANNWVSDLGVPGAPVMFKGHLIHSPLALLLNLGFVINGALVALAGVLLLRPSGQGRMPRWQRWLVVGYGLGMIIAGTFHESPAWSLPLHALGATLIMAVGNIATLLTGRLGARLGLPTWLARTFMALGAVGFISFLITQVVATVSAVLPPNIGTLERFAAYPLLIAQLIAGTALLAGSVRLGNRNVALTR